LTQDTTDSGSCSVIEFGAVCVMSNTKIEEQNTSVGNATWGCLIPHVSKHITPDCIAENQVTLKW